MDRAKNSKFHHFKISLRNDVSNMVDKTYLSYLPISRTMAQHLYMEKCSRMKLICPGAWRRLAHSCMCVRHIDLSPGRGPCGGP